MRFNVFTKQAGVKNHEDAQAFAMDARMELYSTLVTTALSNRFYESADERIDRIRTLIAKNDPVFVARLAIYARTKMNLRSVPLVLAVELAKIHSGNAAVRKTVSGVVKRADEITELLAYYQVANKRKGTKKLNKLSKQIQHGLAVAFNSFDEYQFAKYDRAADITLRDALFLVHPKAVSDQQQLVFNKIAKQTLQVPYTWETELSALGQQKFASTFAKAAAFRAKWEELIASNKLGYMALLRNLRNMLEAEISTDAVAHVCAQLADPVAVAKSKQLPFRFLAAWREVKVLEFGAVPLVLDALEKAVTHSAQNIRGFDAHTSVMIACDVSGSMQKSVSDKSKVMNYDIGLMLAMLLQSRCQHVQTGMFGDTWKIINVSRSNILANVQEFYSREGEVGYATNGYLVLKDLLERKQVVDKVMMFTDCQLWNSDVGDGAQISMTALWKQYKAMVPQARLYLFDLAGYGKTPISIRENGVYLIAGWSDKIFDVLAAVEDGKNALSEIENVVF
ncbi:TROVE domain-containing protein [Chryseolinea lacunae]|uniref:TROVE domain-containing protein n=1 Tax=Chryseolinea lacunae TaxID=2801331 RepID=A0ABS1KQE9_9BACT|nr:TROVE domain-containing protein [Chryseolinea lacunae]MBL0741467.1 TROVE domain-containing protein [Chryseolinea lacunae]